VPEPRVLWGEGMEQFEDGPRFLKAEVVEGGKAIGILLMEHDGTVSSVRIGINDLAD
jgi:hypothetical protein